MSRKIKEWARKARLRLVHDLGGKCVNPDCGEDEFEKLDFDHIHGKDWETTGLSTDQRMSRYRREAKLGLIQILCHVCNAKKGDPRMAAERQKARLMVALGNACTGAGCQNNYIGDLVFVHAGKAGWLPPEGIDFDRQLALCRRRMKVKKLVIMCRECAAVGVENPF